MTSTSHLLERFLKDRDTEAFQELVLRYGPLVLSASRQHLNDPEEIQDAFQATFLIFFEKAPTVRDPEALGSWLFGVARRVSIRAKRRSAQRREREARAAAHRPLGYTEDRVSHQELSRILRTELDRLPDDHRLPLELCALGGLTHEEAAERLGCPVGTVKTRIRRARRTLRERLERRGVGLAMTLLFPVHRIRTSATVLADLPDATMAAVMKSAASVSQPSISAVIRRRRVAALAGAATRGRGRLVWGLALLLGASGLAGMLGLARAIQPRPAAMMARTLPANLMDVLGIECR